MYTNWSLFWEGHHQVVAVSCTLRFVSVLAGRFLIQEVLTPSSSSHSTSYTPGLDRQGDALQEEQDGDGERHNSSFSSCGGSTPASSSLFTSSSNFQPRIGYHLEEILNEYITTPKVINPPGRHTWI